MLTLSACVAPVPRVIKIGLVAPFEGRYRAVGYDAIYAARLAVREINAAGGAGGWQLELVAYDDRAAADMARDTARNLAIDPDVIAVIGHYRQASSEAARPVYAEAGLPWIVVGASVTATEDALTLLALDPERLAAAMLALGAPGTDETTCTAGLWGEGGGAPSVREGNTLAWALRQGIAAGPCRPVPAISPRQAPPPPTVLYSALPPAKSAEHLAAWRDLGWTGALVGGPELAAASFGEIAGPAAEGARFVTPYPFPRDLAGTDAWIAAYRAVGPHVPEPGPYALPTYEAVYLLADAIATGFIGGGEPTRESVAEALPSMRRVGLLGSIRRHHPLPLYAYQWQDAAPVLLAVEPAER